MYMYNCHAYMYCKFPSQFDGVLQCIVQCTLIATYMYIMHVINNIHFVVHTFNVYMQLAIKVIYINYLYKLIKFKNYIVHSIQLSD